MAPRVGGYHPSLSVRVDIECLLAQNGSSEGGDRTKGLSGCPLSAHDVRIQPSRKGSK